MTQPVSARVLLAWAASVASVVLGAVSTAWLQMRRILASGFRDSRHSCTTSERDLA